MTSAPGLEVASAPAAPCLEGEGWEVSKPQVPPPVTRVPASSSLHAAAHMIWGDTQMAFRLRPASAEKSWGQGGRRSSRWSLQGLGSQASTPCATINLHHNTLRLQGAPRAYARVLMGLGSHVLSLDAAVVPQCPGASPAHRRRGSLDLLPRPPHWARPPAAALGPSPLLSA
jgi:hypothetical protein